MPVQFLSAAERARFTRFPATISTEDLHQYFTLTSDDLKKASGQRGMHNRLGFALQVGTLRYLGYCPRVLHHAPRDVVAFVAQQVGVDPDALRKYGRRIHTRTDHYRQVQAHLGYREVTPADLKQLTQWLVERALEHDKPLLLFELAIEKLQADKLVRPGVTRLERLVASARDRAQRQLFERLQPLLTAGHLTLLDGLLHWDPAVQSTRLEWLRQRATVNSPRATLHALAQLQWLRHALVHQWDLGAFTPNHRKHLAQLEQKASVDVLHRMVPERRYPILLAFLGQTHEVVIDELLDLFVDYLSLTHRRAERALDQFRLRTAKATNEKVHLCQQLGQMVLDPQIADEDLRTTIFQWVPQPQLQAAVDECAELMRSLEDHYFDLLAQYYSVIRSFVPSFLATLTFEAHPAYQPLLDAIQLLRQLDREQQREIPAHTSLAFVPAKWKNLATDNQGRVSRRYFELCVLWQLREDLRAGNVWVVGSRRYANLDSYLLPPDQWQARRAEVCQLLQLATDGRQRLAQHATELTQFGTQLDNRLRADAGVWLASEKLHLAALPAVELAERTQAVRQRIGERLPLVELVDLLVEVDRWTQFSAAFTHAGGDASRSDERQRNLYAIILAQACNLGLSGIARMTELTERRLAWYSNWYVREETLVAANTRLVNYQHHQPLSRHWGGGTLSSSDGQRFPVSAQNRDATALPRYFGYGRGLTFYTWTSDQFSQYGTKVIPATVRDATYVLDAILDNETELAILEHTTDTSGFTEMVFALFALLHLQFAPRIRDLSDQRLYRLADSPLPDGLDAVLTGRIRTELIVAHWDELLRVAGSLKLGWVTASLLLSKLQAYPRQNALARALQEYGRLVKTLFILRYASLDTYRRRIETQLNKGEALHALRQFLFFAQQGQLRKRQGELQADQASCLTLVTNAVVTWNTVYIGAVVEQLKREGQHVTDEDLAHVSPARFSHVNPYGKYEFDLSVNWAEGVLRPLRPVSGAES